MINNRRVKAALTAALVVLVVVGGYVVVQFIRASNRTHVVAYFDNSNGIFPGDDVRIRGVNVGKIDKIEPEPTRVKISFWLDSEYAVPADAKAVIVSPTLVTARAVQLTPPYTGGATLQNDAVIPQERTAVPVEWDDVRVQLERLTQALQPTEPGGSSTLGALVHTAADNLRGQGPAIRDAVIKLSQALSALGDHSGDIFTSVKNIATLVTALKDSAGLLETLNGNLASVTGLLADEPGEEAYERRQALAAQHAAAVRRHVDQLSAKSYWAGLEHSPELVLCFLPAESLLAAALDADGGLLDHAFSRNVALVAPVSLLTALKSVAYAWRQDTLAENAHTVVASAKDLYERLGTLGTHLDRMGGSLKTAVDRYNQLVGNVESRVLPAARRLRDADPGLAPTPDIRTLESAPRPLAAPELVAGVEEDELRRRRAESAREA